MKRLLSVFGSIIFLLFLPLFSYAQVIQPGDLIEVYIVDYQGTDLLLGSFSQTTAAGQNPHQLRVSSEGRIYVPHVGVLEVNGKSEKEVEQEIKTRLTDRVKVRELAVLLVSGKLSSIYVLGEVKAPGMFTIDSNRPFESRLMNLIGKAGGLTDRADKGMIQIISKDGHNQVVNLMDMLRNNSVTPNITLSDGDSVLVPQSLSRVYVLGEVRNPGGYPYLEGASYLDYIAEAGGVLDSSDRENIGLVRRLNDQEQVAKVRLSNELARKDAKAPILIGDIIYVPKHFFANWKDLGSMLGIAQSAVYIITTMAKYEF